jgi:hypothetical protein
MAETFSWVPVENDANRPLFARAGYITNLNDLSISLSASDINIGSVELADGVNPSIRASIVSLGTGQGNALKVLTQDLESLVDDITIGDKSGNFAAVNQSLSALRILEVAPVTAVSVTNQLTGLTILNQITSVSVLNTVAISGSVTTTNPITAVNILNTVAISGSLSVINSVSSVSITNQISAFTVLNPVSSVSITNQLTGITILNPTTAVNVSNTVTISGNVTVTNPTTGVNVLNPIALKDLGNNNVSVTPATSSLNVNVTNPVPVSFVAGALNTDAFGRLRVSSPLTLFDSSHRYRDNNLWSSLTAVGGSTSFSQNQGLIEMTVSNLSGSSVIRETTKVFSYQSGKGLLVMNTFVMAPSAQNVIQKVGYYGQDNGIYFQLDEGTPSFVERSLVNGSPSSETIVPLSAWNGDKLDGTGPSGFKLDVTKAQIQWMDIEWLGVGTVRTGFIINGQFILCHSFHHANLIFSTYITTASLPLRYEITNKGATDGSRTMKQICSTVISEGGYELRGLQQAIGTSILSPKDLTTAGTFYPVVTIRLKPSPNRLDAIVILTAISLMGTGSGIYNWQVIASGTTSGGSGTWISAGDDSAVQYKLDATSVSGGRILAGGFFTSNTQGATTIDILKEALFKFQLERNSLTSTPYELTLAVTASTNTELVYGSLDWEEVSR